jgi:hypothetical protein
MKAVLLALCLTLVSANAYAISRYDPTRMTCDQVHAIIDQQSAVILRYQSKRVAGLPLYDRYVSSDAFCERGEMLDPFYVPTRDQNSCEVERCKKVDYDDDPFLRD